MKRETVYAIGAAVALGVLWYAYEHSRESQQPANAAQASGALPVDWMAPMGNVAGSNPQLFDPSNLTLNVANQTPNYLTNTRIPLFGFVGMAQGQMYGT